jgi:hypothetical protein
MANEVAADGLIWVCAACGKRSRDLYGDQRIDHGWDESCMLNAVLCVEESLVFGASGRVVSAKAIPGREP